jgi:hypothetical protein
MLNTLNYPSGVAKCNKINILCKFRDKTSKNMYDGAHTHEELAEQV